MNIDLIQQAIREFNRGRDFPRKNINEKVSILNNTMNNVLSNFIPREAITFDDKKPPWFNKKYRKLNYKKKYFLQISYCQ